MFLPVVFRITMLKKPSFQLEPGNQDQQNWKLWPNGIKGNSCIRDRPDGTTEQDFLSRPHPYLWKLKLFFFLGEKKKSETWRVRVGSSWDITQLSKVLHTPLLKASRRLGDLTAQCGNELLGGLEEHQCLHVQNLIIQMHIVFTLLWTLTFLSSPWPPCSLKNLIASDPGPSVADTALVVSFLL